MSPGDGESLALTAPVGLFEADRDMILRQVNPAMTAMTGRAPSDLAGRFFRDLLTRSSQLIYALKAEHALVGAGSVQEILLELAHTDGRPRPVLLPFPPTATRGAGCCSPRRNDGLTSWSWSPRDRPCSKA